MEKPEVYKVDPRNIHIDQRKQDTRRDAWDRDYMGQYYVKREPTTTKKISNAAPVFVFAFHGTQFSIILNNV